MSKKNFNNNNNFLFHFSKFLKLWQISDGKAFYQIIYSSEQKIIDCEYVRQRRAINHFLKNFYKEVNHAIRKNHSTANLSHKIHLSEHEFREFIENGQVESDFDDLPELKDEFGYFDDEFEANGFSNLTYKQIDGIADVPQDMLQLLNLRQLREKCNQRHREMKKLVHAMSGTNETDRIEATEHITR